MYINEELVDVHFEFKANDEIQRVPANKNVLAAVSSVFNAMFFGSSKERNAVRIEDASADGFKEFLQFFYLDKVTLSMENIGTVIHLADKYDVLEYVKICDVFLKSQLTMENICLGYQVAVILKNEQLIKFCEDEISKASNEIFVTDAFQRCK